MADFTSITQVEVGNSVRFGGDAPVLIAGPCVIENAQMPLEVAQRVKEAAASMGWSYIFKASFDKANRTSGKSFRSIGFDAALDALGMVREKVGVPVLTDIHEPVQAKRVAECVDVLQIPAFLCRQTDLLHAAGETGKSVNIKRGQFMAPEDMIYAVEKITETGNQRVFLTERGASFGYHNLVVDMRALPIMRQFAPVVFDATHSVQQPGGLGGKSGGNREFVPYLARAAAAVGVDGLFVETHPDPSNALSDGPNMVPLEDLPKFLESVMAVWKASQPYVNRLSS